MSSYSAQVSSSLSEFVASRRHAAVATSDSVSRSILPYNTKESLPSKHHIKAINAPAAPLALHDVVAGGGHLPSGDFWWSHRCLLLSQRRIIYQNRFNGLTVTRAQTNRHTNIRATKLWGPASGINMIWSFF